MATNVADLKATLDADTRGFDRKMATSDARFHSMGRSVSTVSSSIGRYTKYAALALGGVGVAGAVMSTKLGLNFFNVREQSQIAFTTMLGDGRKAKKFLDQLAAFAARTPFEFPDLIMASQRLMAMGVAANDVMPVMAAVGDTVAAVGGGAEQIDMVTRAIGQVQAKGRLQAEEMMQLNEAGGFSWRDLAREIGVSVPKAMDQVTKGMVSADEFQKAFVDNANERFGGMMEKQSHTLRGLFSTFKDTFSQISADVLEPFFKGAEGALDDVNKFLSRIAKAKTSEAKIRIVFEGVKGAVGSLFDAIRDALFGAGRKPLKLPTGQMLEFTDDGGLLAQFGTLVDRIPWGIVGQKIGEGISTSIAITADFVNRILSQAQAFIESHEDQFAEIGAQMLLRIVSKLTDPTFWKENWKLILGVAIAVFPLGRVVGLGGRFARMLLRPIASLFPAGLRGIGGRAIDLLLGVLGRLPGRVQGIILNVLEVFGRLPRWIGSTLRTALGRIPGWIRAAFKVSALLTFLGWLNNIIARIQDVISWLGRIHFPSPPSWLKPGPSLVDVITRRQHGGDVMAGHPYIVGEKRAELFIPRTNGTVMSHVPAMAGQTHIHLYNHGVLGSEQEVMRWLREAFARLDRRNG